MSDAIDYMIQDKPDTDSGENRTQVPNFMEAWELESLAFINQLESESGSDPCIASFHHYDINCTVRGLQTIYEYYIGVKPRRMRKTELIAAIVSYENDPGNAALVVQRKRFWDHIHELKSDAFMKRFIVGWVS